MHRKSERGGGVPVGHREASRFVAEVTQAFLGVERNRVVNLAVDAIGDAVTKKVVPPFSQDLIGDVAVSNARLARRQLDAGGARQPLVVERRMLASRGGDPVGLLEPMQRD